MYCNKCGASVAEGTKFCPSCGNDLTAIQNNQVVEQPTTNVGVVNNVEQPVTQETVVQPVNNEAQPVTPTTTQTAVKEDKANVGLAILSWFIPLAGLIIFIVQKDKSPKTAKVSGICALISFLLNLVVVGITILALVGTYSAISNGIEDTANDIINETMDEVEDQMNYDSIYSDDYEDYVGYGDVSKDWEDYELGINGRVYRLPMKYKTLSAATGLTVKDDYLDATLEDKHYGLINLYNNGSLALYTEITNFSGASMKYVDGFVTRISQSKSLLSLGKAEKIIFPGGLKVEDPITEAELIALLGKPSESNTYGTRTIYSYFSSETYTTIDHLKITVVNGVIDEIQLDHRSAVVQ